MKNLRFALQTFLFLSIFCAFAMIADAQATRTWVSGVGDDLNPCSRTAPCKTFAGAISKTLTNGEINCLDPAGYGSVTITKSITIDCTDSFGSILAASGVNGIVVNSAGAVVRLRGISINGAGTGLNGIRVLAAGRLTVENSVIDNFAQHGISVEMTSGGLNVVLNNVSIRNNTIHGINSFLTGTATMNLAISESRLVQNGSVGLNLGAAVKASIKDSVLSSNATGIVGNGTAISVSSCLINGNTTGISAGAGSTIRITGNTITGNATGLSLAGGSILSLGNNLLDGNTTNGAPSGFITPI
ncbi:MAG TPA: hypothetical protein PKY59_02405 [Pyrinomonadaceae bacterium]|nr:hypothetical protein [Pyrinomonadaceae bacterium]